MPHIDLQTLALDRLAIAEARPLNTDTIKLSTPYWLGYVYQDIAALSGVISVFGRTGVVTAQLGDYTTTEISEGTNLYFTNARTIAAVLTGYVSGAGTVAATDTILQAIQKLNGNTAALVTGVSSVNSLTGAVALTGTTDRLTVSAANVFDIAATYVGQASITTLGTITTGTWNGTAIAANKGGTGQTAYTIGDILYASSTSALSKRAIGSTGNVLIVSGGVPTWGTITGAATTDSDYITVYKKLGSGLIAETTFASFVVNSASSATNGVILTSQRAEFFPIIIPKTQTVTGVVWWQSVKGNYVASNENRIGLYTYSGGTLTLVASTANDSALWSGPTSQTMGAKALSSPYAAAAGVYFLGFLFSASSITTAPRILYANSPGAIEDNLLTLDFVNSAKILSYLGSQTTLPSSVAMSGNTIQFNALVGGLY